MNKKELLFTVMTVVGGIFATKFSETTTKKPVLPEERHHLVMESPTLVPLSSSRLVAQPVERLLRPDEHSWLITEQANRILQEHHDAPHGIGFPFDVNGNLYIGRIEKFYYEPDEETPTREYHTRVAVYALF